jgi:hypothetical protein
MLVNLNILAQSVIWHFACKVALGHPGLLPTPSHWLKSKIHDASQGDLFDVVKSAALLNRQIPAESQHLELPNYCPGMICDNHPKYPSDYSCAQSMIVSFPIASERQGHH